MEQPDVEHLRYLLSSDPARVIVEAAVDTPFGSSSPSPELAEVLAEAYRLVGEGFLSAAALEAAGSDPLEAARRYLDGGLAFRADAALSRADLSGLPPEQTVPLLAEVAARRFRVSEALSYPPELVGPEAACHVVRLGFLSSRFADLGEWSGWVPSGSEAETLIDVACAFISGGVSSAAEVAQSGPSTPLLSAVAGLSLPPLPSRFPEEAAVAAALVGDWERFWFHWPADPDHIPSPAALDAVSQALAFRWDRPAAATAAQLAATAGELSDEAVGWWSALSIWAGRRPYAESMGAAVSWMLADAEEAVIAGDVDRAVWLWGRVVEEGSAPRAAYAAFRSSAAVADTAKDLWVRTWERFPWRLDASAAVSEGWLSD